MHSKICKIYANDIAGKEKKMATTKFYLDKRSCRADGTHSLKVGVSHRGRNFFVAVPGVYLTSDQWDAKCEHVVGHSLRNRLNSVVSRFRMGIEDKLLELEMAGKLSSMSMEELRAFVTGRERKQDKNGFVDVMERFAASRSSEGTRGVYRQTLARLRAFCDCDALRFEDITREWLREFEAFLAVTAKSANARAIHLRNIRAVFNYAIDEELTTLYPFRRFKIKSQPTPKRSLPIEELRALFSLDVEPWERRYLDMFKLMFFLCGINIGDLCKLREVRYGRVEYVRAKTHRPYSIKVEPEAMEIIERYRGTGQLLDVLDIYDDYHDFAHRMNHNLKYLGGVRSEVRTAKDGKQRVVSVRSQRWPGLSTYWARHSWATIAASLDIPKETIAAALGHAQSTVTDIYIAFDQRKVDEANRRVIDYVLYG